MKNLRLLLLSFIVATCTEYEDPIEEAIRKSKERCYEGITFDCSSQLTNTYFKGKINGQDFCVSAGVDGYWARNGSGTRGVAEIVNGQIVIDPQKGASGYFFSFGIEPKLVEIGNEGGLYYEKEFLPAVWIHTPVIQSPEIVDAVKILDSFINIGDKFLIKGDKIYEPKRFDFSIDWQCEQLYPERITEYYNLYEHRVGVGYSSRGWEKENYKFKVDEFAKEDLAFSIKYTIKFKIECDLFDYDDKEFVGRLTEGEFRTEFTLPK